MPSGIDIAPIRVRIAEQQLQLAKGLESRQGRAEALPVLEQGEVVPARVLENIGPGRYIVLIKDSPFIAESNISFSNGAEITVRVDRPAPDIRLALVEPLSAGGAEAASEAGQSGTINEYLRWQRANPDGIKNLLTALSDRLDSLKASNTPESRDTRDAGTAGSRTAREAPQAGTSPGGRTGSDPQAARNPESAQAPKGAPGQNAAGTPNQNAPSAPNTQGAQAIGKAPITGPAQAAANAVPNVPDAAAARIAPEAALRLAGLVRRLQYGGGTGDNNWVRNYARDLGLTVESDLLKMLETGADVIKELKERPDLKRALAEVAQLAEAENAAAPAAAERAGLKALAALMDSGIRNIEALQVANVALQDTQGPCAFQAPIVFQGDRGTAHLFIDGEEREAAGKKQTSHKMHLLLDLDRLGAMRVEASLADGGIECLFRCESAAARDLVTGSLDGLKESLEAAGCKVSALGCITDGDVRRENQVSLNERMAGGESLSLFA